MWNQKAYANAYWVVSTVFKSHLNVKATLNSIPEIVEKYKQAGNEAYKADHDFPVALYQDMALTAIRWAIDGYQNIVDADTVQTVFGKVWTFHKKLATSTEPIDWDESLKEAEKIVIGEPKYIRRIVLVVLEDIERNNPTKEQK